MSFDPEQFAAFYEQYERLVRSLVYPLVGPADTDDVVQATFIKCWQRAGEVRDPSAMASWVAIVALNQARDTYRRRKPTAPLTELPEPLAGPNPATQQALVLTCMQRLDFDQREVVVLRYFHDKSIAEIAALLNLPEGTVKSRLYYAKAKLKPWLMQAGVLDA